MASWHLLQGASQEIRNLLEQHEELRSAAVHEVLQNWVDAQQAQESPQVLCAHLVKALTDVAGFCRQHPGGVDNQDLRAALRVALGIPDSKRPSYPSPPRE